MNAQEIMDQWDSQTDRFWDGLDPAHKKFNAFADPLITTIWKDKYRYKDERSAKETMARVASGIYQNDSNDEALSAFDAMWSGLWMPGGRIIAGAGTEKRVTLMNCFTNQVIGDSLDDIMQGVSIAALTQQQGGGIGTDFSTIRPEGAILRRTGARASGPLPFMDMWDAMCATIMSAGDRRGAMMATMCDTHPDLPKFITAKQAKNKLTNFNVSVLVSDAFIDAVKENADWDLYFSVPSSTGIIESFEDDNGVTQYVYSTWKAQDLWALITRNTYEWSEPGVIFIDRINELNNLQYCEDIRCTNPCGEQPLPPNGVCNLGAVNLARLVKKPFTAMAAFDYETLKRVVRIGMRFLDNVIDVTNYPTEEQRAEELSKRRTGLGVSGLADAIAMLGLRYGSHNSVQFTERVFETICIAAYETSCNLAQERDPFPLFDHTHFFNGFAKRLPDQLKREIRLHGIRNGVLLTVAPTGTTSIVFGNISSGIEPVWAHKGKRNVRQGDNSFLTHETIGYGAQIFYIVKGAGPLEERIWEIPSHMVVADDLSIEDHLTIQAAAQRWVDASVSKTINLAESTTYDQFVQVYNLAYSLGCKGCTTYRPSDVRGSILLKADISGLVPSDLGAVLPQQPTLLPRPDALRGITHKIKWPSMSASIYLTVNYTEDGFPFEVFLASKDWTHLDWMTATSLLITSILRKGGDCSFVARELSQVRSIHDTAFLQGPSDEHPKHYGSPVAFLGAILEQYIKPYSLISLTQSSPLSHSPTPTTISPSAQGAAKSEKCPKCFQSTIIRQEGCKVCTNCGYSNCG